MNDKHVVEEKKFKMPSKIRSYKIEKELFTISNGHMCLGTNNNINEKVLIIIYKNYLLLTTK